MLSSTMAFPRSGPSSIRQPKKFLSSSHAEWHGICFPPTLYTTRKQKTECTQCILWLQFLNGCLSLLELLLWPRFSPTSIHSAGSLPTPTFELVARKSLSLFLSPLSFFWALSTGSKNRFGHTHIHTYRHPHAISIFKHLQMNLQTFGTDVEQLRNPPGSKNVQMYLFRYHTCSVHLPSLARAHGFPPFERNRHWANRQRTTIASCLVGCLFGGSTHMWTLNIARPVRKQSQHWRQSKSNPNRQAVLGDVACLPFIVPLLPPSGTLSFEIEEKEAELQRISMRLLHFIQTTPTSLWLSGTGPLKRNAALRRNLIAFSCVYISKDSAPSEWDFWRTGIGVSLHILSVNASEMRCNQMKRKIIKNEFSALFGWVGISFVCWSNLNMKVRAYDIE